ncbi:MAG: 1-phosphofructokinase family hexose kinase [Ruminococcaceae bacterium]|nr:1-phosphofructokinase family hexose kinase [Oscillospiraceae bacterium]
MKIATLTLNPAIDRNILYEEKLCVGGLNRVSNTKINAGGKGINVSRMLKRLGYDSYVYGFNGGRTGRMLDELLAEEGIIPDFTETVAETRMNIKITDISGSETEINEKGGPVSDEEYDNLIAKLKKSDAEVVIIGGSTPYGLKADTVRKIVSILKLQGKQVITDVSGESLKQAILANPYLIKPNRDEFCQLMGEDIDDGEIADRAREFYNTTGIEIILTLGKNGAYYFGRCGNYRITNPEVKAKGFSGAGDTFLASYIYSVCSGSDIREALKFASAASLSKVELEGTNLPCIEHIKANLEKVTINTIN